MIAIQYMSGSYAWVTSTSSYQTPTSKTLLKNMNYVKAEAILKEGGTGNAECKIGKGGKGRKEKSVNAKRKGKGVSRKKEIIDDIINDEVAEVEGEEVLELRNRIIAASRIYGELELIRTGWYKVSSLQKCEFSLRGSTSLTLYLFRTRILLRYKMHVQLIRKNL